MCTAARYVPEYTSLFSLARKCRADPFLLVNMLWKIQALLLLRNMVSVRESRFLFFYPNFIRGVLVFHLGVLIGSRDLRGLKFFVRSRPALAGI